MLGFVQSIARGMMSLLLPTACPVCDRRVEWRGALCPSCEASLSDLRARMPKEGPSEGLIAVAPMIDAVSVLIHRMKYQGQTVAVDLLGEMMAEALLSVEANPRDLLLVPVPLHPARQRERGFNQAESLATAVGRILHCQVRVDLLRRRRWSGSQTTLDARERRRAATGAFALDRPPPQAGRIILVDDVWTTGATAEACRRILLDGGAKPPVPVLVAAVTPRSLPD